jgi:hypothetical protein
MSSSPTSGIPSSPPSSPGLAASSSPQRAEDDEDVVRDKDEEEDGEDLRETALDDYKAIAELDRYDDVDIDEDEHDAIDPQTRAAAERLMRKRDMVSACSGTRTDFRYML